LLTALRRRAVLAIAVAGAIGGAGQAASAQEEVAAADQARPPRVEMWSGGEGFPHFWSVHGGATVAPFGGIRDDGFRLRAVLGYGDYYGAGTATAGDLLIGYHKQLDTVTIKVFAGLTVVDYTPRAPASVLIGTEYGAKGVLEAWWNIADQAWASLDLSVSSTHLDYGGRLRLGWRLWPELSAGLEAGSGGMAEGVFEPDAAAAGKALEHDTSRVGAFLRYEWATGEVSVSGGWAVDGTWREREGGPGPFGTVSLLTRF
jgi:hypothetical protein